MKLTDEQIEKIAYEYEQSVPDSEWNAIGLARAIEAACKPKWLPMESAPRDGTEVLLRDDEDASCFVGFFAGECEGEVYWWVGDSKVYGLTHWMPLPEVE